METQIILSQQITTEWRQSELQSWEFETHFSTWNEKGEVVDKTLIPHFIKSKVTP